MKEFFGKFFSRKNLIMLFSVLILMSVSFTCGLIIGVVGDSASTQPDTVALADVPERIVETAEDAEPLMTATLEPTATPKPTSTPRPTATPKPTDEPKAGSRQQPVPFRTPLFLTMDGNKDFSITVAEILRGQEAWNKVYSANMFNDPAPDGLEWVVVYVIAEYKNNDSDRILELNESDFSYYSKGQVLPYPFIVLPEPAFEDIVLFPGGRAEGWIAGHISASETNPMLVFGFSTAGTGFYLSLYE